MRDTGPLFRRLFPAAVAVSVFAALVHAGLVAIDARSIGLELVHIAALSFLVALFVALPGGAVLLAVVAILKLKPLPSLGLFVAAVQMVAIALEMYPFESGLDDISRQCGLISIPASLVAWYYSVYCASRIR